MWEAKLDRGSVDALEMLMVRSGGSYLDAGAGLGRLTAEIGRRGGYAVGVDASAYAVDLAKMRLRNEDRLEFRQADLRELTFDQAFDGVLCYHVLEHLPCQDTDHVLGRLFRALRPRGTLVLGVPVNDRSLVKTATYQLLKMIHARASEKVIDRTHLCWWTVDQILSRAASAGFILSEIRVYGYLGVPFPRRVLSYRVSRQLVSAVTLSCMRPDPNW